MSIKTFKNLLNAGHGRCYTTLSQSEDKEKYRKVLLWGCLNVLSYDWQCEGTRAAYLYKLVSLFDDKDFFEKKTAQAYSSLSGRNMALFKQMTEFLCFFANNGNADAADALSKKYDLLYAKLLRKRNFENYDYDRDNFEFLTVRMLNDTPQLFEKLISDYGKLFLQNRHYTMYDWFDYFDFTLEKVIGKKRLHKEFKKREHLPEWKCYAENHRKYADEAASIPRSRPEKKTYTAEELKKAIDENGGFRAGRVTRRLADDFEKQKFAALLENEESPEKKANYLFFLFENYPGDHKKLIEYSNSDFEPLARYAQTVLESSKSAVVYDYAAGRFAENPNDSFAICLMLMNYRKEDKARLLSALNGLEIDREGASGWHSVTFQILNCQKHGVKLPKEFYLFIYERSLCSCCRANAVKYMGRHRLLTPEIAEECKYDSNDEIAAYVRKRGK